jgi:hypothetical protein
MATPVRQVDNLDTITPAEQFRRRTTGAIAHAASIGMLTPHEVRHMLTRVHRVTIEMVTTGRRIAACIHPETPHSQTAP